MTISAFSTSRSPSIPAKAAIGAGALPNAATQQSAIFLGQAGRDEISAIWPSASMSTSSSSSSSSSSSFVPPPALHLATLGPPETNLRRPKRDNGEMSQNDAPATHHNASFAFKKNKAGAGGTPFESKGWVATHFPEEFPMMDDGDFPAWTHRDDSERSLPEREREREREREHRSGPGASTFPQLNPDKTALIPAAHRSFASFGHVLRDAFDHVLTFCKSEDVENIAQVNRAWRGAVKRTPASTVVLHALAPDRTAAQLAGRSALGLIQEMRVEAQRKYILSTEVNPQTKLIAFYTSGVLDSDLLMRETSSILDADRLHWFRPGVQYCIPLDCLHLAARNAHLSPAVIRVQSTAILNVPTEKISRTDQLKALGFLYECGRHHLNPDLVRQQCEMIRAMDPAPTVLDRNQLLQTLYRYGSFTRDMIDSEFAALLAGDDLREDRRPLERLYRSGSVHLDADLLVEHCERILALEATRQPGEMLAALFLHGSHSLTSALVGHFSATILAAVPRLGEMFGWTALDALYRAAQPLMNETIFTQESRAIFKLVPRFAVYLLASLYRHGGGSLTPGLITRQSDAILTAFPADANLSHSLMALYQSGHRHLGDALITQERIKIIAHAPEISRLSMLGALYFSIGAGLTPARIVRQCQEIVARLPDGLSPAAHALSALLNAGSAHLDAALIVQLSALIRSALPAEDAHRLLFRIYERAGDKLSDDLLVSESREILTSIHLVGPNATSLGVISLYQAASRLLTDTRITQQSTAILELAPEFPIVPKLRSLYRHGSASFTADLLRQQAAALLAALPRVGPRVCVIAMQSLYEAGMPLMNTDLIARQSTAIRGLTGTLGEQMMPALLKALYAAAGNNMTREFIALEQQRIVDTIKGPMREQLLNLLRQNGGLGDAKSAQ